MPAWAFSVAQAAVSAAMAKVWRNARRELKTIMEMSRKKCFLKYSMSNEQPRRGWVGAVCNQAGFFTLGRSWTFACQATRAVHSSGMAMAAKPANTSPAYTVMSAMENSSPAT